MIDAAALYWKTRLVRCKKALERNNFEVFLAEDPDEARHIVMTRILPELAPKTVSWGDSETLHATEYWKKHGNIYRNKIQMSPEPKHVPL